MSLEIGIVGLPNAGKSTLFNALLKKQQALAANYPFATIEPNVGVVPVPDERLPIIAKLVNTTKIVPATVTFVDIAGLVAGASKGEGLGNQFLSHIREVDLICQVTRFFTDVDVVHVAGSVDPERDQSIIETELVLADLQTVEKTQNSKLKTQNDSEKLKANIITRLYAHLNQGKPARVFPFSDQEKEILRDLHLLSMKPVLQVRNVSEDQLTDVIHAKAGIQDWIPDQVGNDNSVIVSAKIESELASLSEDEQKAYLKELGLTQSGLERLITKAYERLGLISFLTGGEKEARAWTLRRGETALGASGVIHTDFMEKFIKAEVVSFDDFVSCNGWRGSRENGKARLEGKEYVMRNGDVVEFKIGA